MRIRPFLTRQLVRVIEVGGDGRMAAARHVRLPVSPREHRGKLPAGMQRAPTRGTYGKIPQGEEGSVPRNPPAPR